MRLANRTHRDDALKAVAEGFEVSSRAVRVEEQGGSRACVRGGGGGGRALLAARRDKHVGHLRAGPEACVAVKAFPAEAGPCVAAGEAEAQHSSLCTQVTARDLGDPGPGADTVCGGALGSSCRGEAEAEESRLLLLATRCGVWIQILLQPLFCRLFREALCGPFPLDIPSGCQTLFLWRL